MYLSKSKKITIFQMCSINLFEVGALLVEELLPYKRVTDIRIRGL